jgi:hypothetical protein
MLETKVRLSRVPNNKLEEVQESIGIFLVRRSLFIAGKFLQMDVLSAVWDTAMVYSCEILI